MKKSALLSGLLLSVSLSAQAALYTVNYTPSDGNIPDGNLSGWSDTRTVSGITWGNAILNVQVDLNITGGYNGDLYAYLSYGGVLVPLLNRVGVGTGNAFGYENAGMNITLKDGGAGGDIHWYGGAAVPTGTYAPDGRTISPLSTPSSFDAAGTVGFSALNNMSPNGDWTLYFADVSGGGGVSQIGGWSLGFDVVPEPGTWLSGALLLGLAGVGLGRSLWRKRSQPAV